jgi:poly[(R)-3-hydroxyalkanoate] polymerase subunit PhaC
MSKVVMTGRLTEPSTPIQGEGPMKPARLSAPVYHLARELALIALGRSGIAPSTDRRFTDPAWSGHPVYRRIGQQYLALCRAVDAALADRERAGGPVDRTRFLADVLTSALAPTNVLAGNPAAIKKAFDTAGLSLLRGARNLVRDVRHNGAMPATAKRGVLRVGEHLALTAGAVIDRDPVAELLEYAPTTSHVAQIPLLIVPPPIGRFYFLDLQPGRSFVEYAVSRGLRTHLLSWRNPTKGRTRLES